MVDSRGPFDNFIGRKSAALGALGVQDLPPPPHGPQPFSSSSFSEMEGRGGEVVRGGQVVRGGEATEPSVVAPAAEVTEPRIADIPEFDDEEGGIKMMVSQRG